MNTECPSICSCHFFFLKFIYLFIFVCVGSSLLHTGFLQLWRTGASLCCGAQASHCGGFSCCRAQALGVRASVVAHGLSSCGTWAQLLRSMWDLPGRWLEPVTLALAGGFLTTATQGKAPSSCHLSVDFFKQSFVVFIVQSSMFYQTQLGNFKNEFLLILLFRIKYFRFFKVSSLLH